MITILKKDTSHLQMYLSLLKNLENLALKFSLLSGGTFFTCEKFLQTSSKTRL